MTLFDAYCKEQGIKHRVIPQKTPHDYVAKGMNRTLVQRIRYMLSNAKLPINFWGEALMTAIYLINLSPCYAVQGDIPENVWSDRELSYDHLKVFGCKAMVCDPQDEKLQPNAQQHIFLGFGVHDDGYKLFDPIPRKVVRRKDIAKAKVHQQ